MSKTPLITVPEFETRVKLAGINPHIDLGTMQNKLVTKRSFVPVNAKLNGKQFKANLVPLGKGKFRLYLPGVIRKKTKVEVGNIVKVSLKEDRKPRVEKIPDLLSTELKKDVVMKKNWLQLTPSRKKEMYVI